MGAQPILGVRSQRVPPAGYLAGCPPSGESRALVKPSQTSALSSHGRVVKVRVKRYAVRGCTVGSALRATPFLRGELHTSARPATLSARMKPTEPARPTAAQAAAFAQRAQSVRPRHPGEQRLDLVFARQPGQSGRVWYAG